MSSDLPEPNIRRDPPTELPPVEPPSARFIIQLFVIPAVIVLVLVVAYLAFVQLPFGRLANGGRDVMDYVRSIKSPNEHRRWRSAQDLANLINNDANLAKDSRLLGELTALLDDELRSPAKSKAQLPQFLALALGTFQTTKADPVDGRPVDPIASLCNALGSDQPTEVRVAAAISLSRLSDRLGELVSADPRPRDALVAALSSSEAEVQQRVSYALGYFPGEKSVEALKTRLIADDKTPFDADQLVAVRYNAAAALARLGSPAAKDTIREMLSPIDLAQTLKRASQSETETAIQAVELEAIWGLGASPRNAQSSLLLESVRSEVEALARTGPKEVQIEAQNLLKKLPTTK